MPVGQAEEIIALSLVFVVHVVGGAMLVWALLDADQRAGWRNPPRPPRGGDDDAPTAAPPPQPGGGAAVRPVRPVRPPLPLADGTPSRVRLREPVRVADRYPPPARRPAHPEQPLPRPVSAPERRRRA